MMPGLDADGLAPLLEQRFDYAIEDVKALGDLFYLKSSSISASSSHS